MNYTLQYHCLQITWGHLLSMVAAPWRNQVLHQVFSAILNKAEPRDVPSADGKVYLLCPLLVRVSHTDIKILHPKSYRGLSKAIF